MINPEFLGARLSGLDARVNTKITSIDLGTDSATLDKNLITCPKGRYRYTFSGNKLTRK
jgi:hypothetical protein